jgi:hypothetical protein
LLYAFLVVFLDHVGLSHGMLFASVFLLNQRRPSYFWALSDDECEW